MWLGTLTQPRIATDIRVGSRLDKTGTLENKVSSVVDLLASVHIRPPSNLGQSRPLSPLTAIHTHPPPDSKDKAEQSSA